MQKVVIWLLLNLCIVEYNLFRTRNLCDFSCYTFKIHQMTTIYMSVRIKQILSGSECKFHLAIIFLPFHFEPLNICIINNGKVNACSRCNIPAIDLYHAFTILVNYCFMFPRINMNANIHCAWHRTSISSSLSLLTMSWNGVKSRWPHVIKVYNLARDRVYFSKWW